MMTTLNKLLKDTFTQVVIEARTQEQRQLSRARRQIRAANTVNDVVDTLARFTSSDINQLKKQFARQKYYDDGDDLKYIKNTALGMINQLYQSSKHQDQ